MTARTWIRIKEIQRGLWDQNFGMWLQIVDTPFWVILPSHFLFLIIILHVAISGASLLPLPRHSPCGDDHGPMDDRFSPRFFSELEECPGLLWFQPGGMVASIHSEAIHGGFLRGMGHAVFVRCLAMGDFILVLWEYHKTGTSEKKVVSICFSQILDFGLREYILWPGWLCEGPIPINNFSQTNEIFVLILVTQHKFWTTQRLSRSFPYFSSYCTSPCLIACVAWLCFDIEVGSPGLINRPLKRPMCSMMGCLEMIWTWWGDWGNHETYAGI